jgi:hypothetical protein
VIEELHSSVAYMFVMQCMQCFSMTSLAWDSPFILSHTIPTYIMYIALLHLHMLILLPTLLLLCVMSPCPVLSQEPPYFHITSPPSLYSHPQLQDGEETGNEESSHLKDSHYGASLLDIHEVHSHRVSTPSLSLLHSLFYLS